MNNVIITSLCKVCYRGNVKSRLNVKFCGTSFVNSEKSTEFRYVFSQHAPRGQPFFAKNPAETVQAILSQIKTTMGNSSTIELFAVLETENNTKEQVEAQKSAIQTNGVTNYILYNAEGNYQF
mgnify:CR=1 FL=1